MITALKDYANHHLVFVEMKSLHNGSQRYLLYIKSYVLEFEILLINVLTWSERGC